LEQNGQIIRFARGKYARLDKGNLKVEYSYEPSELMKQIEDAVAKQFPLVNFQVWELIQWNEFVNHQIAHNAIFVEVEYGLSDYVFDFLKEKYENVMLKPDKESYYRYMSDNMIVIQQLVSGAPAPLKGTKQASIEKMLVDLFSRKLTGSFIEHAEYPHILEDAFQKYRINESSMFRYARRRNLEKLIKEYIDENTDIRLETGK